MSETLTEEQKLASLRFQEQAVLMLRIKELYTKNEKTHDESGKDLLDHKYENFVRIDPESASVSEAINGIYKTKNVFFLQNIPPAIYSLLIPKITIYKTFYESEKSAGFDWELPFDDYLGASEISSNSLDFLRTNNEGRLNGVGIKSFKYDYLAVNFAEVDSNIKANLVLTANSVEDFVKIIDIQPNHPNYVPYTKGPSQPQKFSYHDLVTTSLRRSNLDKTNPYKWNPHYYRIKVICGYSIGDRNEMIDKIGRIGYTYRSKDGTLLFPTREDVAKLVDGIAQSKVILNLTPISFDININETGTAELNIEYRASVDTVLREEESDIFLIGELGQQFLNKKREVEQKTKDSKKKIEDIALESCRGSKTTEDAKKEKDNVYKELEELNKQLTLKRSELHGNFLKTLVQEFGIYKITVPREELGASLDKSYSEARVSNQRLQSFRSGNNARVEIIRNPASNSDINKVRSVVVSADTRESVAEKTQEKINEEAIARATGNNYYFYYFYLGDLLNYCLRVFKSSLLPKEQLPKIILGPMYLQTPSNLPVSGFAEPDETILNLSDIPISLNLFTDFYMEHVVKTQRDNYYIKDLIYDLFKDNGLITAALSPRAFGIEFAGYRERLTILPVTSIGGEEENDRLIDVPVVPYSEDKPFGKKTINLLKIKDGSAYDLELRLTNKESNYIFLYVTSQFPKSLQKNFTDELSREEQNTEKGIYNFRIGSEVGLLKSVKFSRITQPFLREARAFNEGEITSGRLISKFNATIDLFGNNIFRPGEYVYINPNFIVTRNVLNSAYLSNPALGESFTTYPDKTSFLTSELGVGGYYLINKVNTNIAEGVYSTTLDCVFQAYPNRTPSKVGEIITPCVEEESKESEKEPSLIDKTINFGKEVVSFFGF